MLEHMVSRLGQSLDPVIVVAAPEQRLPDSLPESRPNPPMIEGLSSRMAMFDIEWAERDKFGSDAILSQKTCSPR